MNYSKYKFVVLITTHNRKETVLDCLDCVYKQNLFSQIDLDIYLLIDGSTDGTENAVSELYPTVKLFFSSGDLYWSRGMNYIFSEAIKVGYDFYIWLNEDTFLYNNAFNVLFDTYIKVKKYNDFNIVAGTTIDPKYGNISYGGCNRSSWWHPLRFRNIVQPTIKPEACDTINGNCVLIPNIVVKRVGNIDESFIHSKGDFDYGLRAKKLGCSLWVAIDYVGLCERNLSVTTVKKGLSLKDNLKQIFGPKDLPFYDNLLYLKRHGGTF